MKLEAPGGATPAPSSQEAGKMERRIVVRNLVNAPFDIESLDGPLLLPALGETEPARFTEDQIVVMQASLALEIVERDSAKSETATAGGEDDDRGLAKLRAEYQELIGKRPFHGWDAAEIQKRIDEALAA
jgi:hypothetical protein